MKTSTYTSHTEQKLSNMPHSEAMTIFRKKSIFCNRMPRDAPSNFPIQEVLNSSTKTKNSMKNLLQICFIFSRVFDEI